MPVITLTTDWGRRDHYVAAFKGGLISACPQAQIIDITHDVNHFDILQASFILKNCFEKFPTGTIHYIGLSTNSNAGKRNLLVIRHKEHYFIGFDNGTFFLTMGDLEKEIIKIDARVINTADESSA